MSIAKVRSICWLALVASLSSCSSNFVLPERVLGSWYEEYREGSAPDTIDTLNRLTDKRNVLKFEQVGQKAFVSGGEVYDIGDKPFRWSVPYRLRQLGDDSWEFERGDKLVQVKLRDDGRLSVKGLYWRAEVLQLATHPDGSLIPSKTQVSSIESSFVRVSTVPQDGLPSAEHEASRLRAGNNITSDSAKPDHVGLMLAEIVAWKNATEIAWGFQNLFDGATAVSVRIDHFEDQDDSSNKNPFGDGSETANTFVIGSIPLRGNVATEYRAPTKKGMFKYIVTVKVELSSGKSITDSAEGLLIVRK